MHTPSAQPHRAAQIPQQVNLKPCSNPCNFRVEPFCYSHHHHPHCLALCASHINNTAAHWTARSQCFCVSNVQQDVDDDDDFLAALDLDRCSSPHTLIIFSPFFASYVYKLRKRLLTTMCSNDSIVAEAKASSQGSQGREGRGATLLPNTSIISPEKAEKAEKMRQLAELKRNAEIEHQRTQEKVANNMPVAWLLLQVLLAPSNMFRIALLSAVCNV